MLWWKVELADDGGVKQCSAVEAAETGSATVIYVQGETADQAIDKALGRYRRLHALKNLSARRSYTRRQAQGICRSCPKKLAPGSKKFCATHAEEARTYMRSYMSDYNRTGPRGRKAAEPKPAKPKRAPRDPVIAEARRSQQHRIYCAMRTALPKVLAKFDELDPDRPYSRFREWLLLEISSRSGAPGNDVAQAAE